MWAIFNQSATPASAGPDARPNPAVSRTLAWVPYEQLQGALTGWV